MSVGIMNSFCLTHCRDIGDGGVAEVNLLDDEIPF